MASSGARQQAPTISLPLMGFVVGKYFEFAHGGPDNVGIQRNIDAAIESAKPLIRRGFLVFVPHLNTHHFQSFTRIDPDPIKNEEFYRAFDRRLLAKVNFVYASPNAWNSTGGRLEMMLACHLGVPIFWNDRDLLLWATRQADPDAKTEPFSVLRYEEISDDAINFGTEDVPIVLVDGPHWTMNGVELDEEQVIRNEQVAERHAIELFNLKIAAFTPHQNSSFRRLGFQTPRDRYEALSTEMLSRIADAVYLLPGWEEEQAVKERVRLAKTLGKPVFNSKNELVKWRDGRTDYFTVNLGV